MKDEEESIVKEKEVKKVKRRTFGEERKERKKYVLQLQDERLRPILHECQYDKQFTTVFHFALLKYVLL